jgi:hypothetical protein
MTKHILDRPSPVSHARLREALRLARKSKPHAASLTLQRRPRAGSALTRLTNYVKIAREEARTE